METCPTSSNNYEKSRDARLYFSIIKAKITILQTYYTNQWFIRILDILFPIAFMFLNAVVRPLIFVMLVLPLFRCLSLHP